LSPDTPKEAPPKPEEDNLAPLASVIRGLRKDLEVLSGQLRVILERLAL
jgi:RecA/RadA recombinase